MDPRGFLFKWDNCDTAAVVSWRRMKCNKKLPSLVWNPVLEVTYSPPDWCTSSPAERHTRSALRPTGGSTQPCHVPRHRLFNSRWIWHLPKSITRQCVCSELWTSEHTLLGMLICRTESLLLSVNRFTYDVWTWTWRCLTPTYCTKYI